MANAKNCPVEHVALDDDQGEVVVRGCEVTVKYRRNGASPGAGPSNTSSSGSSVTGVALQYPAQVILDKQTVEEEMRVLRNDVVDVLMLIMNIDQWEVRNALLYDLNIDKREAVRPRHKTSTRLDLEVIVNCMVDMGEMRTLCVCAKRRTGKEGYREKLEDLIERYERIRGRNGTQKEPESQPYWQSPRTERQPDA